MWQAAIEWSIMVREICIGIFPVFIGFILDCIAGDPYCLPHPVRWIGRLIGGLEQCLRKPDKNIKQPKDTVRIKREIVKERLSGMLLVLLVLLISTGIPAFILYIAYHWCTWAGVVIEGIFCYYLIAAKCLKDESMKVYQALVSGGRDSLIQGRKAVSMIVGRDTEELDKEGVIKAAVETVAENTSDGVTAPLFYIALGGGVLGFFYKAANTLDSMIGYKNEKYRYFGTFAAKLDDVLNYIPSRVTALLMIAASFLCHMNGKNAFYIWRRDRRRHKSPNAAQTEAVCAGALDIMLAGDACYFGKLERKDTIGDAVRPVRPEDIKRANSLMYTTAVFMLVLVLAVRGFLFYALFR